MQLEIKGRRNYHFLQEDIYQTLLELPSIAGDFAVIQKVENPSEGHYIFTFHVNFQMYSGTYYAEVYIRNQRSPEYLQLYGTHKSRMGNISIDLDVLIKPDSESNQLIISGKFNVGGMMRFAGRTILKTGVNNGLRLMFDFLDKKLAERYPTKEVN